MQHTTMVEAKFKLLVLHTLRKLLWAALTGAGLLLSLILGGGVAHAAACTVPSPDLGIASSSISVPAAGTYRVWSRLMAPNATANTYSLEVDGTTCVAVGGNAADIGTSVWKWVNYQDGSTTTITSMTLSAGTHSIRMIGQAADVELDRLIFTTDVACVPTGTGDNCASAPDTTLPVTSITAPAAGATVSGSVNITATASDNVGVTKVEFYIDGTLKSTDTATPYAYSWNSTAAANGLHALTTKAYDAAGNMGTSTAVSVTVSNTVPDTTPPVTSITAPVAGASISGITSITATASDNVGVTKVEFYVDGALKSTDAATPYAYSWDSSTATSGSHSLTTKAYDAAGNIGISAAVTVTVGNLVPGDANGDGHVTIVDLSILATNYGKSGMTWAQGDFNGDGTVNILDLSIQATNWGK